MGGNFGRLHVGSSSSIPVSSSVASGSSYSSSDSASDAGSSLASASRSSMTSSSAGAPGTRPSSFCVFCFLHFLLWAFKQRVVVHETTKRYFLSFKSLAVSPFPRRRTFSSIEVESSVECSNSIRPELSRQPSLPEQCSRSM